MKKYLILLLLISSCGIQDKPFDSKTWQAIDGNNFSELREPIVNDLIKNHLYKGMTCKEVVKLLGKPEIFGDKNKKEIGYILYLKIDVIDDVAGTDLLIKLSDDSLLQSFKIIKWKK